MKKLLLSLVILTGTSWAYGASDRFGSPRQEVTRTSFTASADIGVVIASNPTGGGAPMVLRSISCSGVNATTVTVSDSMIYNTNTSTKAVFSYVPTNPGAHLGSYPSQVFYSIFMSSAIKYTKDGGSAPCNISWDFLTEPRFNVPYRP